MTSSMLGYLGTNNGFSSQQEALATHGLAYLLGHEALADAFLRMIGRPGLVTAKLDWRPEVTIGKGGRLDVAACVEARSGRGGDLGAIRVSSYSGRTVVWRCASGRSASRQRSRHASRSTWGIEG